MDTSGRGEIMGSRPDEDQVQPMDDIGNLRNYIINRISNSTIRGDWTVVLILYRRNPEVQGAKINRSGDTVLHRAVSDGQEYVVEKLVEVDPKEGHEATKEALGMKNERGNTPLHLAAALGSVRMCNCIASRYPELIGVRNNDSETPLFLAALNGKTDAFLLLHSLCGTEKGYAYSRTKYGETTLHSAIDGEYFDLAFQIIHRYENLVHSVNEQGISPLHLLASKPSAFKSGSQIGWLGKIIYFCTCVDKLEVKPIPKEMEVAKYPKNYQTCNFFRVLFCIRFIKGKNILKETDTESQDHYNKMFQPNYRTCIEAIKHFPVIFGFRAVKEKKEKHTWSLQIMNELLLRSWDYEYQNNGQKPQYLQLYEEGETMAYGIYSEPTQTNPDQDIFEKGSTSDLKMVIEMLRASWPGHQVIKNGQKMEQVGAPMMWSTQNSYVARQNNQRNKFETPILIAAKNGITEIITDILEQTPEAINDENSEGKNMMFLAMENRKSQVYRLLVEGNLFRKDWFHKMDSKGNNALHVAAILNAYRPWLAPNPVLQMQWEIKWYEYIKKSVPRDLLTRRNIDGETPDECFRETHRQLVNDGTEWLMKTSDSCMIVATLIGTVAFATSATVPGDFNQSGEPNLKTERMFDAFSVSSLTALCFSLTAVVMFLSTLTSRHQAADFRSSLPLKLLIGLTSLFISITSMLVSFSCGHFFILRGALRHAWVAEYLVVILPVAIFVIVQFPLYFKLFLATVKKVPEHGFSATT